MPNLSKKVTFLCRKAQFPIKYCPKNVSILRSMLNSLDRTIPLRSLVRDMISKIEPSWTITESSLYLAVLRYVYSIFLSHSSNSTTLSVIGSTDKLLLNPEGQDFIKDYPLYKYRLGNIMLPEGEEWISDPRFSQIEDEPDISFCIPWDYEVDDWKYAFLEIDSYKADEMGKYLRFKGSELFKNKLLSRNLDLTKFQRYMSDTSYFDPELDSIKTFKKIDHLKIGDLINEIKHPTIKRFEMLRKQIYVSPNNIRDTFIPSWKTFCAMYAIESLCDQIIDREPKIRIGKVNNNLHYGKYHIMIDIKKFGITFPKEIIIQMIGMLEQLFHVDLHQYKEAYNNFVLYKDDEILKPIRGFGLGNFNKLATIAHYLIAESSGLDFYVYSDDIVYICDKEPDLEILNHLEEYYNSFGLILNRKKCYISKDWEFLGESSNEFFEQVESNHCTLLFSNSFFSTTLLEGEEKEKNALDLYKDCRDLWLKNHEIHPILREDLLHYPRSMGGWVSTNTPLSYCYSGDLLPSLYTQIKSPPKKISYKEADEYYDIGYPVDYYINSLVKTLVISKRNRYSSWKTLQFFIKEEKRYKNAKIGYKNNLSLIKFGVKHFDIPECLLKLRKSPSQIKAYVKVPPILKNNGLPSPYPVISIRDSDRYLLHQLSFFTDYPIYTKYMLELKLGKGIMSINYDIPLDHKSKVDSELSLMLLLITYEEDSYTYELPFSDLEEPYAFDELDLSNIESIREKLRDSAKHEEEEDLDGLSDSDYLSDIPSEEEEGIEIEIDDDLDDLDF